MEDGCRYAHIMVKFHGTGGGASIFVCQQILPSIHAFTSSRVFPWEEVRMCALSRHFFPYAYSRVHCLFIQPLSYSWLKTVYFHGLLLTTLVVRSTNHTIWEIGTFVSKVRKGGEGEGWIILALNPQWTLMTMSSPKPKEYFGPWCMVCSMEHDPCTTHW